MKALFRAAGIIGIFLATQAWATVTIDYAGPHTVHLSYSHSLTHPNAEIRLVHVRPSGSETILAQDSGANPSISGERREVGLAAGELHTYEIRQRMDAGEWSAWRFVSVTLDGLSASGVLLFDETVSDIQVARTVQVPQGKKLTINGEISGTSNPYIFVYGAIDFGSGARAPASLPELEIHLHADHSFQGLTGLGRFVLKDAASATFTQCEDIRVAPEGGRLTLTDSSATVVGGSLHNAAEVTIRGPMSRLSVTGTSGAGLFLFESGEIEITAGSVFGGVTRVEFKPSVVIHGQPRFEGEADVMIADNTEFTGTVFVYGNDTQDAVRFQADGALFSGMRVDRVAPGTFTVMNSYFSQTPSSLVINGGVPKFVSCELAGAVGLFGRTGVEFRGCVFLDNIHITLSIVSGVPNWNESGPSPTIVNNAFMGERAFTLGSIGATISIAPNYYGDPKGMIFHLSEFDPPPRGYLGHDADGGQSRLGALWRRESAYGGGSMVFANPLQYNPVPGRKDKRVLPKFWVTGHIVGQGTLSHDPNVNPILIKGRDTLLSVHVVTSDNNLTGARVYAKWNGATVHAAGPARMYRDHSLYSPAEVRNGRATFNIALPGVSQSSMEVQVYLDVSGVSGFDPNAYPAQDRLLFTRTVTFTDPPGRPLRIFVTPVEVLSFLGYSWGTPNAEPVVRMLQHDLPDMLPIPKSQVQVTQGPLRRVWSPTSSLSAAGVMKLLAISGGSVRALLARNSDLAPDFVVFVLPRQLVQAYFPNTIFDLQSFDGVTMSYSTRILFVAEHRADAVLHELGHGIGLYLPPPPFGRAEQYYLHPPHGKALAGESSFTMETKGQRRANHYARSEDFWYSGDSLDHVYDIMGNVGKSAGNAWAIRTTHDAFHQWFQSNLQAPAGGMGVLAASRGFLSPMNETPGSRRILLTGGSDDYRLQPDALHLLDVTGEGLDPIPPDDYPNLNYQRLIAFDATGQRLHALRFNVPQRATVWQATFDVPEETDSIAVVRVLNYEGDEGEVLFFQRRLGVQAVNILSPSGGATVSGWFDVEWELVSDTAPLTGDVRYSMAYRATPTDPWIALALTEDARITVDANTLPETSTLALRIMASDGIRSVEGIVHNLTITRTPPSVRIHEPRDGDRAQAMRRIPWRKPLAGFELGAWGWTDQPMETGFTALAGGGAHSLALTPEGGIVGWGHDAWGQATGGPTGVVFAAVAAGDRHSLALNAAGELVSWGNDAHHQVSDTPAGNPFDAVAAGGDHSLALNADGAITAWGRDDHGQVADTPPDLGFTAVSAGALHNLALASDGALVSWGNDEHGQVGDTPVGTTFTAVAAGGGHSLALTVDGTIVSWGRDYHGQVTDTPAGSGFTAIAAGGDHSLALTADGMIVSWGRNDFGQVSDIPDGANSVAIAAGSLHSLALGDFFTLVPFEWTLSAAIEDHGDGDFGEGAWTSSLDGELGTGSLIETALSVGAHGLRYEATNSLGAVAFAEVSVTVLETMEEVDLTLATVEPGLQNASVDAAGYGPVYVLTNAINSVSFQFRNEGVDAAARLRVFMQPPSGPEALLGEYDLRLDPFDVIGVTVPFHAAGPGDYLFRAVLDDVDPPDPDPANNEMSWSFTTPPDIVVRTVTTVASPLPAGFLRGAGPYLDGAEVNVMAIPLPGANFSHWSNSGTPVSSNAAHTFTIDADMNLTAHFDWNEYEVTLIADPDTLGSVSGEGTFTHGDPVTVTAHPNPNHRLVRWTEDAVEVSTNPVYAFMVTKDRTLTAHFDLQIYGITVAADPEGQGTVEGGGTFTHGDTVTVFATAEPGFMFVRWSVGGQHVSSDATYIFTATASRDLVAHFAEDIEFAGGSGVAHDPYLIATPEHLDAIRNHLAAHFRSIADLDLGGSPWSDGEGWAPLGWVPNLWDYPEGDAFTGVLDGNGHTISNLTINRSAAHSQGLIGVMAGGEVRNLTLANVNVRGSSRVGALVGSQLGGTVHNCHSSGQVSAVWDSVGGLVGALDAGLIEYSSSSANVSAGYFIAGGLVGDSSGTIRRSYATGSVATGGPVGGLVGRIPAGRIEDCYAMGTVTDTEEWGPAGGLVGGDWWTEAVIRNCYAIGAVHGDEGLGGLVGAWDGMWDEETDPVGGVASSYWNTQTSGLEESAAGAGRTTSDMTYPHDADTYVGWDFDVVWAMDTDGSMNDGYPYLRGPASVVFTLIYRAGTGGALDGVTIQTVAAGEGGTAVMAVEENDSSVFLAWSDGRTDQTRTDTNVQDDLDVTARFRSVGGADLDWYAARGIEPEGGETWAEVDARRVPEKGTTLREENIADTDPEDPEDTFRILEIASGPPPVFVFRPGSTGRVYRLLAKDNLLGGWTNVPGAGPRSGGGMATDTLSDTNAPPAGKFYRIEVGLP